MANFFTHPKTKHLNINKSYPLELTLFAPQYNSSQSNGPTLTQHTHGKQLNLRAKLLAPYVMD
jgi:hypothetical protein